MIKRIVVYGYYNHNSLGDQLFIDAFKKLLPDNELVFVDRITKDTTGDALIIGGGSFLNAPINANHYHDGAKALTLEEPIFEKPLAYIGVGAGNKRHLDLHIDHEILIRKASLVALR